jgi:hypothetical protein
VLKDGGWFFVNVSDHIRDREVQPVTQWHLGQLAGLGFEPVEVVQVKTPRNRRGANHQARVTHETVAVLAKMSEGTTLREQKGSHHE